MFQPGFQGNADSLSNFGKIEGIPLFFNISFLKMEKLKIKLIFFILIVSSSDLIAAVFICCFYHLQSFCWHDLVHW